MRLLLPAVRLLPRAVWPAVVVLLLLLYTGLTGCAVIDVRADGHITPRATWVLLPVQNLGEAPMAGERVEELLLTLMRTEKGIEMSSYTTGTPGPGAGKEGDAALDLDERQRFEKAVAWAKQQKFAYGIGGSVQEWRYRSASEGEAAVGVTLRVIDLNSGRVVFTASGSKAGWGRDTLNGTAQRLLRSMLGSLPLE